MARNAEYFRPLHVPHTHTECPAHKQRGNSENDICLPFSLAWEPSTPQFFRSPIGDFFEGQTYEGHPDGYGVNLSVNGDAYAGQWCQGRRHGWGAMLRSNGVKYEGTWVAGQRSGFGIQTLPNGFKYVGQFAHNARHGLGVLLQSNGAIYGGVWEMGETVMRELVFQQYAQEGSLESKSRSQVVEKNPETETASHTETGNTRDTDRTLDTSADRHPPETTPDVTDGRSVLSVRTRHEESDSISSPPHSSSSSSSSNGHTSLTQSSSSSSSNNGDTSLSKDLYREFATQFAKIQNSSRASSIARWSVGEVAYLFNRAGFAEISEIFTQEGIDGEVLRLIVKDSNNLLRELGVKDPCLRRCVTLFLEMLFKLERRCKMEQAFVPRIQLDLNFELSTKGLVLERRIGEGAYGRVYKGRYYFDGTTPRTGQTRTKSVNCIPVAVKVFRPRGGVIAAATRNPLFREKHDPYFLERLQTQQCAAARDFYGELGLLTRLRHPNVVLFLGAVSRPLYCLVTEFVPCGSLFDLIHRHRKPLTLSQIIGIAAEIACGMAYIHSQGVLHCDLKSSNILLSETGCVKICDFGLAVSLEGERSKNRFDASSSSTVLLGCVGTHQWMAPEILRGEAYSAGSDVFSFGMILWEMLARRVPYQGMPLVHIVAWEGYGGLGPTKSTLLRLKEEHTNQDRNIKADNAEEILAEVPEELLSIFNHCVHGCPTERPNFAEIATMLNGLQKVADLELKENLRVFFGQD